MFAALGNFFSWKLFEEKRALFFEGLITHSPKQFIKLCYSKQIEILFLIFVVENTNHFSTKSQKNLKLTNQC